MLLPLEKLRIIRVRRNENGSSSEFGKGFTVQINPETLSLRHRIDYRNETNESSGGSGSENNWERNRPDTLTFDILFDRTGAVQQGLEQGFEAFLGNAAALLTGVEQDIADLKEVVYNYDGERHRPNQVKIVWGKALSLPGQLAFVGQLTQMDLSYKLFNRAGIALRATVSMAFQGVKQDRLNEAFRNRQSTDITHIVTIQEGDSLPLLARKIYGDHRYFLPLAKANGIHRIRNLKPGTQVSFPPIEK